MRRSETRAVVPTREQARTIGMSDPEWKAHMARAERHGLTVPKTTKPKRR
jgi:hypothetical protein